MLSKSDFTNIQSLINDLEKRTKNEILKNQDKIMGSLDKIDLELAVSQVDPDRLNKHEKRLDNLEKIHPQGRHSLQ